MDKHYITEWYTSCGVVRLSNHRTNITVLKNKKNVTVIKL